MEIRDIFLLASERSERDTIRGVQIRAGAVYIYIYWRASEASETLSGKSEIYFYWRAREARETLSGVYKFELVRYYWRASEASGHSQM